MAGTIIGSTSDKSRCKLTVLPDTNPTCKKADHYLMDGGDEYS